MRGVAWELSFSSITCYAYSTTKSRFVEGIRHVSLMCSTNRISCILHGAPRRAQKLGTLFFHKSLTAIRWRQRSWTKRMVDTHRKAGIREQNQILLSCSVPGYDTKPQGISTIGTNHYVTARESDSPLWSRPDTKGCDKFADNQPYAAVLYRHWPNSTIDKAQESPALKRDNQGPKKNKWK